MRWPPQYRPYVDLSDRVPHSNPGTRVRDAGLFAGTEVLLGGAAGTVLHAVAEVLLGWTLAKPSGVAATGTGDDEQQQAEPATHPAQSTE